MNPKTEIFEQFADLARVLGQGNRLELLEHAAQGERSVERLAQLTGLSVANASQHLQVLRRAGFVRSRRDGKRVLYRLGDGPVVELLGALRRYAEHSRAEVRGIVSAYFNKLDSLEPVSREALLERLDDGSTLLLDVRPEDEFALGHLPGALNIPLVRSRTASRRVADGYPDRRLLPRSLLRLVVRGRRRPACQRLRRQAAGGGLSRVEGGWFAAWKATLTD